MNDRKKARKALHKWYKNVGKTRIREIISVRDTIKSKEEYVLNYFNNRSTNASAESFNSKIKGLRTQVHGVNDLPFFLFRCAKIFGGDGGDAGYPRKITPAPKKTYSHDVHPRR